MIGQISAVSRKEPALEPVSETGGPLDSPRHRRRVPGRHAGGLSGGCPAACQRV